METTMPETAKLATCELIIDKARERSVTVHANEFAGIRWYEKTITTGDYAILGPDERLLAVIERKTLSDYGSSIKDGRHANKRKLIAAREQTGCRIIYIVEGPDPAKKSDPQADRATCGGIPWKTIESSMIHLSLRDDISHYRTRDSIHTARMLANMVKYYDSLIADGKPLPPLSPHVGRNGGEDDPPESLTLLTASHHKTIHQCVTEMWAVFRGISAESADEYIRLWTLAEIVLGVTPREVITSAKIRGRKLTKSVEASLSGINRPVETKLLACVPGISVVVARELTAKYDLKTLLGLSAEEAKQIKVGKAQKSLGEKAEKIAACFAYTTRVEDGVSGTQQHQ